MAKRTTHPYKRAHAQDIERKAKKEK